MNPMFDYMNSQLRILEYMSFNYYFENTNLALVLRKLNFSICILIAICSQFVISDKVSQSHGVRIPKFDRILCF